MNNSYFHGSDTYIGHCPMCGTRTGTNYDELCERCEDDQPVKCPQCLNMVDPKDITLHGICKECTDVNAEGFTTRVTDQINMIDFANELLANVYSITNTYKPNKQ